MVAEIVFKGFAVICMIHAGGLAALAFSPCLGNPKVVRASLCSAVVILTAAICCAVAGSLT